MKSLKVFGESFKNEFPEFKVKVSGSCVDNNKYEDYVLIKLNSNDLEQSYNQYFNRIEKVLNKLFKKQIKLENTGKETYTYKYTETTLNCKQFKVVVTNENKNKYFHHEDIEVRFELNKNETVDVYIEYNHYKERTDLTCEKDKLNFEVIAKIVQNEFKEFHVGDFDYSSKFHMYYVTTNLTLQENFKYFDKVQKIANIVFCDNIDLKNTGITKDYNESEIKQFVFNKKVIKKDNFTYIHEIKVEFVDNEIKIYFSEEREKIDLD